jgi:hypothetical protein
MSRRVQLVLGATAVMARGGSTAQTSRRGKRWPASCAAMATENADGGALEDLSGVSHQHAAQLRNLLRQCLAMGTYILSFVYRCLRSPVDRKVFRTWPTRLMAGGRECKCAGRYAG